MYFEDVNYPCYYYRAAPNMTVPVPMPSPMPTPMSSAPMGTAPATLTPNTAIPMDMAPFIPQPAGKPIDLSSQAPGTILRIYIPAGMILNLLNIIEVASPYGISLIVRMPFLGDSPTLSQVIQAITRAGGSVELLN